MGEGEASRGKEIGVLWGMGGVKGRENLNVLGKRERMILNFYYIIYYIIYCIFIMLIGYIYTWILIIKLQVACGLFIGKI